MKTFKIQRDDLELSITFSTWAEISEALVNNRSLFYSPELVEAKYKRNFDQAKGKVICFNDYEDPCPNGTLREKKAAMRGSGKLNIWRITDYYGPEFSALRETIKLSRRLHVSVATSFPDIYDYLLRNDVEDGALIYDGVEAEFRLIGPIYPYLLETFESKTE